MHKKDRERTEKAFMEGVLAEVDEMYVAFATEGAPYVIPLNFAYSGGSIFIHCALEGRKLDLVRRNPLVGFSAATGIRIIREKSTTRYRSVCGAGRASLVEDRDEKIAALEAISKRYASNCPSPTPEKSLARVNVLRIDITEMCGKESADPA